MCSVRVGGVVGSNIQKLLSKEIKREQLEPWDHIYTWTPDNSKSHGIYVGDGNVIHFNPMLEVAGQVLCSSIDDFVDGGKLYLFEYGVNPVVFLAKPQGGGTCNLISDIPEVVKYRASFLLDRGFRVHDQDLYENSSKVFAVYCKTGLLSIRVSMSHPTAALLAIPCAVFNFILSIFTPTTPSGLVAAVVVTYCTCRLAFDIGARQDVKVAVEGLTRVKVKELGYRPTLKTWSSLVFSIWIYLVFQLPECITLFCWAIFQRNFNFRSWVLLNKIRVDQLQPGDHIYTWRGYSYSHHGIYAGNGEVIHIVRAGGRGRGRGSFLYGSSPFYSSNNHVESISIEDFASGGELYRYEYGVNVGYFIAKIRGGTCTLASSDPPTDVLQRASLLLHYKRKRGEKSKVIVGAYDLFSNNCEDFAIYCKTSLVVSNFVPVGRSGQIACLFAVVVGFINFTHQYLTSNLISVAASFCIYSTLRMISDTKYRWDTSRIPVEQLADFEKFGDRNSRAYLVVFLKNVVLATIGFMSFGCKIFQLFGKDWDITLGNKYLDWIISSILLWQIFF